MESVTLIPNMLSRLACILFIINDQVDISKHNLVQG